MERRGLLKDVVAGTAVLATLRLAPLALLVAACWLVFADFAVAHHVLGRPSYSLGEDSNTPSSLQAETQIGDYFVTYMVFPAFPKPERPGRISLSFAHSTTRPISISHGCCGSCRSSCAAAGSK